MRTTIDLPDHNYRQAKATAALTGVSMKTLIRHWVEVGLAAGDLPAARRNVKARDLPDVVAPRGRGLRSLTGAEIQELLDVDDGSRG